MNCQSDSIATNTQIDANQKKYYIKMKKNLEIEPHEIKAELCLRSFFFFLNEFIEEVDPKGKQYVWNWHVKIICDAFEKIVRNIIANNPSYSVNLNVPPGSTKSTIVSRVATPWIWTISPTFTTINVTRADSNAKNFANKARELIKSEKYQKYFPYIKLKKEPDSYQYFENTQGGVRYGLTTESKSSTGKHADLVIFDDIYAYNDMLSIKGLISLENSIDGYLSRFKETKYTSVFNTMQRLGYNDATAYLFEGYDGGNPKINEVENICLPAKLNEYVSPPELKEKYIDGLLDPVRKDRDTLNKEMLKYGYSYDTQFLQVPLPPKEGLMYPVIPEYDHETPEGITMTFTDPADKGNDYLCTWFLRLTQSELYVYDAIYTKEPNEVTIPLLAERLKGSSLNWIETNGMGAIFVGQLKRLLPNVQGKNNTVNKSVRILASAHNIQFFKFKKNGSEEFQMAKQHMRKIPRSLQNDTSVYDIDSADAFTTMANYINAKYPVFFTM